MRKRVFIGSRGATDAFELEAFGRASSPLPRGLGRLALTQDDTDPAIGRQHMMSRTGA